MQKPLNDENYINHQVETISAMYNSWSKLNEQQTSKLLEIAEKIKCETDVLMRRGASATKDLAGAFDNALHQRLGLDKSQLSRLRKIGEHAGKLREVAHYMDFGERLGYQLAKINEEIGLEEILANGGKLPTTVASAAQKRAKVKIDDTNSGNGTGGAGLRIVFTGWHDIGAAAETTLSIIKREKTVRAKVPKGVTAAMIASNRVVFDKVASRVSEY